MQTVPEEALILVGVLPEPRDLEIARLLGWYRIPLKSAPKVIDVDFLAFYQTGAFGEEHRWKIEYFCPVRGHELVTRADLFRDEPDHRRAHEEYYKLSLGPLEMVRNSIKADSWKRITFLYTLGELFNKAATIGELVVHSENRQILWRSLREHLPTEQRTENIGDDPILDDPAMLEALMLWMELPEKKNNLYRN
ncbi:MAG: hypothetical protein GYA15_14915 [Leptolinea sp.]|jgi:hypothetical protein|nr:hypothetical protein [Leptolinea sp.]